MTTTPRAKRIAYRKQARADLCGSGFWIFTASLYGGTFASVALLTFVGRVVAVYIFNASVSEFIEPLPAAFWCANFIEMIFLIAITVLYVWGGMSGISFRSSHKNDNDVACQTVERTGAQRDATDAQ